MKTSQFIFKTDYPETGETLLYNTLNGALLAIDEEKTDRLNTILYQKTDIPVDSDLEQLLMEEEFLIFDDYNEINVVLERSNLGISDENRLDVIIMPTMNCNFACPYCYEDHHKSNMTEETQNQLVTWFERVAPKFKTVLINWFGGEPLLGYDTIVNLQQRFIRICKDNDIPYSSHITTNGYLINELRAKELVQLGIYSYQITIDGSPEFHNKTRVLKNGDGTFDKILKNVILLAEASEEVNIKLRVNYDDKNIKSIYHLLPLFPAHIRHQLVLVCERIFGESYGIFEDESINHGDEVAELYRFAADLGYSTSQDELVPGRLTFCYADRHNQFLFNYNGDVFKCTVGKFKPEQRLGILNEFGQIEWEKSKLGDWYATDTFEEKCYTCTYMPVCMGGCRKVRKMFGTVGDDCTTPFLGFDTNVRNMYTQFLNNKNNVYAKSEIQN